MTRSKLEKFDFEKMPKWLIIWNGWSIATKTSVVEELLNTDGMHLKCRCTNKHTTH